MSKHKAPAPSVEDSVRMLAEAVSGPLAFRLVAYPTVDYGRVMASAELIYTHQNGETGIVRRDGEVVSTRSTDQLMGAWYRAALRLNVWAEGKDVDEVINLYLWKSGKRR